MVTHTKKTNQRFTTSYTYDEYDRMTTQTYPSGKVIGYAYDDKGKLVSISIDGTPFISNIKSDDTKDINYEYDKTENIIKDDKHTYTYDSRNRLTAIDNNVTYQYNYAENYGKIIQLK